MLKSLKGPMSVSKQSRSGSAFVPSPQWLSKSPARLPSSTASGTPLLLRRRTPRYSPGDSGGRFEGGLVSPVPPPPENLFPEPQTPFNVDPGVPFLATEGDSQRAASESLKEDGSSSQRDSERYVGGRLVSGIKNTVRRSLRRNRRDYNEPEFIVDASDIYDSGYSSALASAPEAQRQRRSSTAEAVTSHEGVPKTGVIVPVQQPEYPVHYRRRPRRKSTADIAISHEGYPVGYDPILGLGRLSTSSMRSGASPHTTTSSTHISRTSDYRGMTHLQSAVSFNTYVQRFKRFMEHLGSLPFSGRFRVTYDYDPERERRDDPRRLPVIVWQRPDFQPTDEPSSSSKKRDQAEYQPTIEPPSISIQPVQIPPPPIIVPPSRPQPLTITHHPVAAPPTLVQPAPFVIPSPAVTVVDDTWFDTFNNTSSPKPVSTTTTTTTGSSKRNRQWRASTPYRPAVPVPVPAPVANHAMATEAPTRRTPVDLHPPHQHQYYSYNRRRDGYVPAELAESHYGARYGPGIHSARAGVA